MRNPCLDIDLADYFDFGSTPVRFSDHILADTTDRLFPVSKHRSRRVHKKLVKRFGGVFRKAPAIYMIEGEVFAHTSYREEFRRRFGRQGSPTGRLQSPDRCFRWNDVPPKLTTVVEHIDAIDDIDVVEHMQTKKSVHELLDADGRKVPDYRELELRAMGHLIAEQIKRHEEASVFKALMYRNPADGERVTNQKSSAESQKPVSARDMLKTINDQITALDIRPSYRSSIFRDRHGF